MRGWSRRECAVLGAAAAMDGSIAPAFAEDAFPSPSLDALAQAKGLRFGCAISTRDVADPRYRDIVRAECGVLVAENEHKWPFVHPAPSTFTYERGDQLVEFGEANGLLFRGHNLIWHHPNWLPRWVTNYDFGADPRAEAEGLLRGHIGEVCRHYGTRIGSWDVVNETIDAVSGAMRETVFTRRLGPQVIDIAFRAAREAAPHAQLVYNDYMSWEAHSAAHRAGVLRFLEGLLARGVPVDALGVQGHIGTENSDSSTGFATQQEQEWRRFMDEIAGMGLAILVTEFDVHDKGLPADIAARDRAVADHARAYLDLMLSYTQVKQVLTWGIVDHRSWLQDRWRRPDRRAKRPLPYDENYRPKLLRDAIAQAFRAAPSR
jgi:endo-1,4-beta-xylanase